MKPFRVLHTASRTTFTADTAADALTHYERIRANRLSGAHIYWRKGLLWHRIFAHTLRKMIADTAEAAMVDRAFRQ